MKAQLDAEFTLLRDGSGRQQTALDAAPEDRLVSVRDYYTQKTAIEQREVDAEIARKQQELARSQQVASHRQSRKRPPARKAEVARRKPTNHAQQPAHGHRAGQCAQRPRKPSVSLSMPWRRREELAMQITGTVTDADRQSRPLSAATAVISGTTGGRKRRRRWPFVDRLIKEGGARPILGAGTQWRQGHRASA